MKKMTVLKVLVVLVLCVVGLGFYQGWFVLSRSSPESGSNKVDVKLTLDPDKAKADADSMKSKARGLSDGAAESEPPAPDDRAKSDDKSKNE